MEARPFRGSTRLSAILNSASSLVDYRTLPTAWYATPLLYNPATNSVTVNVAGTVVSGINFGSATLYIDANNVTVKDCTFGAQSSYYSVQQAGSASGTTVENCTFTGSTTPSPNAGTFIVASNSINIIDNSFVNAPTSALHVGSNAVVSGNYIQGGSWQTNGAHADGVVVNGSNTSITGNFIDWTISPGETEMGQAVRVEAIYANVSNVSVAGNYLIGGAYTVDAGNEVSNGYTISNISVDDNYIGFGQYGDFDIYGAKAATYGGNVVFDFTNSVDSTKAWAVYKAAGLPTATLVTSTGANVAAGNVATTLYGAGYDVYLCGGSALNNFVGGFGTQYLQGGSGENVFRYLAISDSTPSAYDIISNFHPATDVIDLSAIDGNVSQAGVQNFSFIGTAAFSGPGAQVRYQQDVANDCTWVEADVASDSGNLSPDFEVKIRGLQTLTAANFDLGSTPAVVPPTPAALATAGVLTSTGANVVAGNVPTTLYGAGYDVYLCGGSALNIFVGGFGTQYLQGGSGENIFTYLSVSDSTPSHYDIISNFDPAKDVIDLSAIDGDVSQAGVQNFSFIGTAAFSGPGAQGRYQQDVANDCTWVEANLASDSGNSSPDFEVKIRGLWNLTAGNFALTSTQSQADIAAGDALQVAGTHSGTATEYAYTNVQGQPYSSYESFYNTTSGLLAESLNTSSTASQLNLYGANLTIVRGSGAESLQVGSSSLSVGYRAAESIQAAGAETFELGSNYGSETINGFATSGANADTMQLSTSSFSFLNSSMTQAADLAALLNPSNGSVSTSGGNTTIKDSFGDSLTLNGVAPSTIAAAASQFRFV